MSNLVYQELQFRKEPERVKEIVRDLLEVWDDAHHIIICHPNSIFACKPITREIKDFDSVEWEDLKEEIFIDEHNCYVNMMPEAQDSYDYIIKRFRHELTYCKGQEPRHLAVLEQDKMGGNLVRGIFKATKEGCYVAENPLYTKYKPKSSYEKTVRLTANINNSLAEFIENAIEDEGDNL